MGATGKKPKTPHDLEKLAGLLEVRMDALLAAAEKMKGEGMKSVDIAGEPMFKSGTAAEQTAKQVERQIEAARAYGSQGDQGGGR